MHVSEPFVRRPVATSLLMLARPRKFRELRESLAGVAPAVLSQRLKVLEEHGIVRRGLYSDHPPRAEYALTDRGAELRPVVRALGVWGSRHLRGEWTFVHDACGEPIEIAYYCAACDMNVAADAVERRPNAPPKRRRTQPQPSRPAGRSRSVRH